MRPYTILSLLLCLLGFTACEPPEEIKPSPPPGSYAYGTQLNEVGSDILELADGNFLLVGGQQNEDDGDYDVSLTKIDPNGGEMWTRLYREDDGDQFGKHILEVDNGYVMLVLSGDGNYSAASIELHWLDEDFDVVSVRRIGNPSGSYGGSESASGFFQMANGGFVITSFSYAGLYLIRTDADGVPGEPFELNSYSYTSSENFIAKKPNGGFAMVSQDGTGGSNELSLYHFDGNAELVRIEEVFLNGSVPPEIKGFSAATDSTYYVSFSEYDSDPELIQIDSTGNVLQEVSLGSTGNFNILLPQADGSIFVGGGDTQYGYSGNGADAYLGVVSASGNYQEISRVGGDQSERMRSAILSSNGAVYMIGHTQSYGAGGTDMFLVIVQP